MKLSSPSLTQNLLNSLTSLNTFLYLSLLPTCLDTLYPGGRAILLLRLRNILFLSSFPCPFHF